MYMHHCVCVPSGSSILVAFQKSWTKEHHPCNKVDWCLLRHGGDERWRPWLAFIELINDAWDQGPGPVWLTRLSKQLKNRAAWPNLQQTVLNKFHPHQDVHLQLPRHPNHQLFFSGRSVERGGDFLAWQLSICLQPKVVIGRARMFVLKKRRYQWNNCAWHIYVCMFKHGTSPPVFFLVAFRQ